MTDSVTDPNPDNNEVKDGDTALLDEGKPVEKVTKPDEKPADKPADKAGEPFEYPATGDAGTDLALSFLGKNGFGPDDPAMQAAFDGDFTLLEAQLAAKGVQGWEQHVALGKQAYAREKAKADESAKAVKAVCVAAAGGEDEWKAVKAWASSNATPEEKAHINGLLNQGGLPAKLAAEYLVNAYNKAGVAIKNPKDAAGDDRGKGGGGGNSGPLSPREYSAAVNELNARLKGRMEGSPEYKALQQRRAAWRG